MIEVLSAILAILVVYFLYTQTQKPENFPPGPPRLPIIGNLPFLMKRKSPGEPLTLIGAIHDLHGKYGDVIGAYIGMDRAVIIANADKMRTFLKSDDTSSRPNLRPFNELRLHHQALKGTENEHCMPGVSTINGEHWKEQRRFILRNLRDFGFGKKQMQDLLVNEWEKLNTKILQFDGKPTKINRLLNISIINALMVILFGDSFELDDPQVIEVLTVLETAFRETSGPNPLIASLLPHPSMMKWPIIDYFSGWSKIKPAFEGMTQTMKKFFDEHLKTFDSSNIRDFLDLMLLEVKTTTDPKSSFYKDRGMCFTLNNLTDLFSAGSETTSTMLQWSMLYMLHYPEIKAKVQKELDQVCGAQDLPTVQMRDELPYTNAVIHEIFRYSKLAPLSLPHVTSKDLPLDGYIIPKGTTIISAIAFVHFDPKNFKNPEVFNPDRFINDSGEFKASDQVIPFGVGKRHCLGQTLAEQEFFIFFTGLMKKFDISPAPGTTLPSCSCDKNTGNGIVLTAPIFEMVFKAR